MYQGIFVLLIRDPFNSSIQLVRIGWSTVKLMCVPLLTLLYDKLSSENRQPIYNWNVHLFWRNVCLL